MRRPLFATLIALAALPAAADTAALEALREGSLKKLVFDDPSPAATDVTFSDLDGGSHTLADYAGQVVLLNFWATWCAPCREEMPALDALNASLGGEDFRVITVATGRNPPTAMRRFFEEEGIETLPLMTDPRQELARNMAVLGLPVSILIDRQGNEIARLVGDADWNSDSARAIVSTLIDGGAES